MSRKTRLGLYRTSVSLWVILALLFAPFSSDPSALEAPCSEPEASLRGRRLRKGLRRAGGLLRSLLYLLKACLILLLLAWMLAHTRSLKDLLREVVAWPAPNARTARPTTPCQPAKTPRTTPDLQHPFLQALHQDPTVQRYQATFDLIDEIGPPPNPHKRGPKKDKNTDLVYLKAYLVKLNEPLRFFTHLRTFLVERPALVAYMGFVLKGYTPQYGFDPQRTVVSAHQFSQKLRTGKENRAKALFLQTVLILKALGVLTGNVSCDTAEVHAPIKENNPKQYVKDRFDKENIPNAAPSARLGVKPTHEKDPHTGKKKVRYFWGWKSAILAEKNRRFGVEVCGAETTKPANSADVNFALPLLKAYRQHTKVFVQRFLADAAFDAWDIYQDVFGDKDDPQHGQAYIPINPRGHDPKPNQVGPHGGIIAPCGKEMKPESAWFDKSKGYHRRRDQCPYTQTQRQKGTVSCPCNHPQVHSKRGCTRTINLDDPQKLRFALNRQSKEFKQAFKERTTVERLFAHANQANFEHPNVRDGHAVAQLNTLTYTLINLKAILKVRAA
jgi:hypothetical protein